MLLGCAAITAISGDDGFCCCCSAAAFCFRQGPPPAPRVLGGRTRGQVHSCPLMPNNALSIPAIRNIRIRKMRIASKDRALLRFDAVLPPPEGARETAPADRIRCTAGPCRLAIAVRREARTPGAAGSRAQSVTPRYNPYSACN